MNRDEENVLLRERDRSSDGRLREIAAMKGSSEFSHFLAKVHRCGPPQIGDLSPMWRKSVLSLALPSRLLSVAFPVRADAPLDFIATGSGVKLNLSSVNRRC